MRRLILSSILVGLAVGLSCQQRAEEPRPNLEQKMPPSRAAQNRILARIHFKGFDQLATGTSASTLQAIWKLPQTETLRTMALEKLAPSILKGSLDTSQQMDTNAVALLRPLLEDLLRSESVFMLVERSNRPPAWTLAIRLEEARKDLWRESSDKFV